LSAKTEAVDKTTTKCIRALLEFIFLVPVPHRTSAADAMDWLLELLKDGETKRFMDHLLWFLKLQMKDLHSGILSIMKTGTKKTEPDSSVTDTTRKQQQQHQQQEQQQQHQQQQQQKQEQQQPLRSFITEKKIQIKEQFSQ
jgi:hypothetical protein